jgi:hypothetical protein
MPPIEPIDEDDMERSQSPQGPPFEHRMAFFNTIIGAMHDAQDELAQDGLGEDLVTQIVANTICHALAYAAVNLDLPRQDLAEIFLRYCADVEAAQNNIGVRLDS